MPKSIEQSYKNLFESSLVAVFRADLEGNILDANDAFSKILNIDQAQQVNIKQLCASPEDADLLLSKLHSQGRIENCEIAHMPKEGTELWLSVSARLVDDSIEGFMMDISKLKLTEMRLRESEASKAAILSAVPDIIFVMDKTGKFLEVHTFDSHLLPMSKRELEGSTLQAAMPAPIADMFLNVISSLKEGEINHIEYSQETANSQNYFEARIVQLDSSRVLAIIRDITARKLDEQKLKFISEFEALITRLSTHFLELPTEKVDQGIHVALEAIAIFAEVDATFILQFPNQTEQDMTYYWSKRSEKEVKRMQRMLRLNTFPVLRSHLEKEHILNVSDINELAHEAPKEYNLLKKEAVKSFICIPMMRGNDLIGTLGLAMFDRNNVWPEDLDSLLKIASEMFTNALMRKSIDEQVNGLYESQSKLFSQIAHSLKTPFTVALSNLELLRHSKSNSERERYISSIKSNLRESTAIINQLLQIARMDLFPVGAKPNALEMSQLLEEIYTKATALFHSYFPDITTEQLASHLVKGPFAQFETLGDKRSLTEAILILIDNAFRHSPPAGQMPEVSLSGRIQDGRYKITVEDKGKGIPKPELARIFELYYQGSGAGEGSGIGLAFCKKVVDSMGGQVQITSQVGKGTRAEISFELKPITSH